MKTVIAISLVSVLLSGCNYASQQALGKAAVPINPTKGQRLATAKIYRVRGDGTMYRICKPDEINRAIRAIDVTKEIDTNESLADEIAGEGIVLTFPGVPAVRMPYYKTRVTGYSVTRASWPSDDDFATYVRKSVGKNCRALLDKGNVLIVEAEARAKKSSQLYKGPVNEIPLGLGVVKVGDEWVTTAPQNVTFGVIPGRK